MDVGTISMVVVFGLIILLAIGMPLGFASAFLAVVVLVLKFESTIFTHFYCYLGAECEGIRITGMLTGRPGTGALYLNTQKIFDLMTEYVLLSVPLFIFMAALLERSGVAKEMYNALNVWLDRTRGGIAIVTSLMAVLMAAMSGIIGGEVVLLGLIALPQMLRLGYNQNLAIGTICASGSLGTMIPPSIVLIIYGLITETSIKSLFTGAFIPGFMLASFIILYIVVRTQLRPQDAPLPENPIDYSEWGTALLPKIIFGAIALLGLLFLGQKVMQFMAGEATGGGIFFGIVVAAITAAFAAATMSEKGQLFLAFLTTTAVGFAGVVLARVVFFTVTGQNQNMDEGVDPISLGMPHHILWVGIALLAFLAIALLAFGPARCKKGWQMGRGLVPPMIVIGAVLGSIYGGITGITEAAGMGALAVFLISVVMYKSVPEWKIFFFEQRARIILIAIGTAIAASIPIILGWESQAIISSMVVIAVFMYWCMRIPGQVDLVWEAVLRTLRSTGTIIWVTIGAAALAGAYTLVGGPKYIANLIVGADMPTMLVLLSMMLILLFMGAFMDWVGIVLLIIPVFLPIVKALPIEEIGFIGQLEPKYISIWFGVLFCMNMQVSFLSPPFGPAAFYLKSVAPPHISLTDIFKGFLPFIGVQLCALTVLLVWPSIVTILLK